MRARQEKPALKGGPAAAQGILRSNSPHVPQSGLAEGTAPIADLSAFRTDNGAGMALLQQAWFVGWCSQGCYAVRHVECCVGFRAMQVKKGANSGGLKHAVPNCRGPYDLTAAKVPRRMKQPTKVLV